jgi:sporulation protein YlmC with PRC-barrel domain
LSKTEKKNYVPSQTFIGKQIIDVKGAMIGTVKDLAVSVGELDLALIVATKSGADIQIPWAEIQSIEDVVLLNRTIELPKVPEPPTVIPTPIPSSSVPTAQCPSCKTTVPSHAKFCPKCGARIK